MSEARNSPQPGANDLVCDVVVGSAAGLNAMRGWARYRIAVVAARQPRNAHAGRIQGFLTRNGPQSAALPTAGRDEVALYGVDLPEDRVEQIAHGFCVQLAGGPLLKARRVAGDRRDARRTVRSPQGSGAVGQRPAALLLLPQLQSPRPAHRSAERPPPTLWRADAAAAVRRRLLPSRPALSGQGRGQLTACGRHIADGATHWPDRMLATSSIPGWAHSSPEHREHGNPHRAHSSPRQHHRCSHSPPADKAWTLAPEPDAPHASSQPRVRVLAVGQATLICTTTLTRSTCLVSRGNSASTHQIYWSRPRTGCPTAGYCCSAGGSQTSTADASCPGLGQPSSGTPLRRPSWRSPTRRWWQCA